MSSCDSWQPNLTVRTLGSAGIGHNVAAAGAVRDKTRNRYQVGVEEFAFITTDDIAVRCRGGRQVGRRTREHTRHQFFGPALGGRVLKKPLRKMLVLVNRDPELAVRLCGPGAVAD